MSGVAHVSFSHGGVFLPAVSLEDRLAVAEYVARLLRSEDTVQILIDNNRWVAESERGTPRSCVRCHTAIRTTYREASRRQASHCLQCALVHGAEASVHHTECCCWTTS